ncbi:DUF523 domain-containing protein [Inmirania thermothiophila]|uniref:Uncharacterized protein YbbK (DUF523 family) n=1 Tax=Inmirania thermothiophila TaxID=1750597 RepID=A0A3N1XSA6_9GAMM|nr:DUF523 domain-containing protein [Inmirania thermothiophila]ROR29543.1 uncharacterized protein YbbK (DUF523 family) [Inmirania thermothiophila]
MARPRIGVSACLLGETVRYDGGHRRDPVVAEVLARTFDLVPLCPEVAAGLGVPRPPVHLVGAAHAPRAVGVDDPARDVTAALAAQAETEILTTLDGVILKARSPSCGIASTPIHDARGNVHALGAGVFARALRRARPLLPMAEAERLADPGRRLAFVLAVLVHHHARRPRRLAALHEAVAPLLEGCDRAAGRRAAALARRGRGRAAARRYTALALAVLARPRSAARLRRAARGWIPAPARAKIAR